MKEHNQAIWWVVGLIAALMIGGAAMYILMKQPDETLKSNEKTTSQNSTQSELVKAGAIIIFTNSGFEKNSYTVKKGQMVEVKNQSSTQLEFSSDNHPTHTDEPELNLSVLRPGQSASFTPTETGNHGFHDHLQAQYAGTLIVTD